MTWREKIVQNIKDCGQSLVDNAEAIAGGVHYQRGIAITCHVDEIEEPPYITVEVSYYPESSIERNI